MDKPWLKEYPEQVPAEINCDQYESLVDVLTQTVQKFGNRPAYTNMGTTLDFNDIDKQSKAFAAYLQQSVGLQPGDRMAIMIPNLLQYPVVLFGALRAGLTVVNVNPLYTPRELKHQLKDSGVRAIVILENFANILAQVLTSTDIKQVITTEVGDLLKFPKSKIVNFVLQFA